MDETANEVNYEFPGVSGLVRGVAVWVLIIGAESINGTFRELLLVPRFGSQISRQISFGIALVLIMIISAATIRWISVCGIYNQLVIGAIWALLTLVFEVALGRFVMGVSWETVFADYNIAGGGLMAFGLVFMLFAPLLASRLREDGERHTK